MEGCFLQYVVFKSNPEFSYFSAEQVYSLPIEQRTNCNYLIGIQIEKVQLQNRLKEILKDQNILRRRIEQLNAIEKELQNLQVEYKMANKNCTGQFWSNCVFVLIFLF